MQAKKKPIEQVTLGSLGTDTGLSTSYARFELPPKRSGSVVFVESVDDLIDKLAEHYQRPAQPARWSARYDADDVAAVFGDR
jgi:electron transfer flavoprotein alpha/beta subunit